MPTYEYRCPKGHEFERVQRMADPPRAKCPICGRNAVLQISGGAALIFKGSGFYITDYGKDGKGPRKDKEPEAKPEAAPAKSDASAATPGPVPKTDKAEKGEKSEKSDKSDKKSSRKQGPS